MKFEFLHFMLVIAVMAGIGAIGSTFTDKGKETTGLYLAVITAAITAAGTAHQSKGVD